MDVITLALARRAINQALEGHGVIQGKSAYEIAVEEGYTGTEEQWLASLVGAQGPKGDPGATGAAGADGQDGKDGRDGADGQDGANGADGRDGYTPYIGENGNWWINGADTHITAKGATDYEELTNKPTIPETTSELTNDAGFTTDQDFKTINGEAVVGEGNIELDLDATMGKDFVTNTAVGYIPTGTTITSDMTVAQVLYKMLYKATPTTDKMNIYFGGCDSIPTGIDDLSWKESMENLDVNTVLANGIIHRVKTGNPETEEGQYGTIITTKAVKLVKLIKWAAQGAEAIPLTFTTIEKPDMYIYYLGIKSYDEDLGGATYVFNFEEV